MLYSCAKKLLLRKSAVSDFGLFFLFKGNIEMGLERESRKVTAEKLSGSRFRETLMEAFP